MSIPRLLLLTVCAALLVGCGPGPEPRLSAVQEDIALAKANNLARQAWAKGLYAQAAEHYAAALWRARGMDAPRPIADAAYNLAACQLRLGRPDEAATLLQIAEAEMTRTGGATAEILLLQSTAQRRLGHLDQADLRARRAIEAPGADGQVRALAQASLAASALERGQLDQAETDLAGAFQGAADATAETRSTLLGVRGDLHAARNKWGRAGQAYDRQAELLRFAGLFEQMARALEQAGMAYQRAADPALAADRFFRAARSLLGLGMQQEGLALAQRADNQARAADAPDLAERIARMQRQWTTNQQESP
jgi:tetratricopeptide (TPR) repeat protein